MSVGKMSGGHRRDADKRNYQPLAPPLWLDHTAFRPVKTIGTAGIPPLDILEARAPAFHPYRGILLGVTHNISQRAVI